MGDRVLSVNGFQALNMSKFMEGLSVEGEGWTDRRRSKAWLDFLVLRFYPQPPATLHLRIPKTTTLYFYHDTRTLAAAAHSHDLLQHDRVETVDGLEVTNALAAFHAAPGPEVSLRVSRGFACTCFSLCLVGVYWLGTGWNGEHGLEESSDRTFHRVHIGVSNAMVPTGLYVDDGVLGDGTTLLSVFKTEAGSIAATAGLSQPLTRFLSPRNLTKHLVGLHTLDVIRRIEGEPVNDSAHMQNIVIGLDNAPFTLTVQRSHDVHRMAALNKVLSFNSSMNACERSLSGDLAGAGEPRAVADCGLRPRHRDPPPPVPA